MDYQLVDDYIIANSKYFTETDLMKVRETLMAMDHDGFFYEKPTYRNPIVVFVVSLFFGTLGLDRFLLGDVKGGVIKFLTMGLFGLWLLYDWIMIMKITKQQNYRLFQSVISKLQ